MKAIIFTLLIGTIFAVACASPAPSKLQSLQALLQSVEEEKQAQLMDDDDDDDVDAQIICTRHWCGGPLPHLIQQKMAKMQDDDKLADAQIFRRLKKLFGWWFYYMAGNLLDCQFNTVIELWNEYLSDLG